MWKSQRKLTARNFSSGAGRLQLSLNAAAIGKSGRTVLGILGVRPFTLHSLKLQAFEGGIVKLSHLPTQDIRLPSFVAVPDK